MIQELVGILINNAQVTALVDADNITPVKRVQGTAINAIVVDVLDVRTTPTKDSASKDDFYELEVICYADNNFNCTKIMTACRNAIAPYLNTADSDGYEFRFRDYQTAYVQQDDNLFSISMQYWGYKKTT